MTRSLHWLLVLLPLGTLACSSGDSPTDDTGDAATDEGGGETPGDADVPELPTDEGTGPDDAGEPDDVVEPDDTTEPDDATAAEDVPLPDAGEDDATTPDATDAVPDTPADTGPDGTVDNQCQAADGICTASMFCTTETIPGGAAGCVFDDGPGVCCRPPAPQPSGETCASYGGICATVGGCLMVDGWFTPADCASGASVVCCVIESVCGPHDQICCTPGTGADFRPVCDRGTLTCPFDGTTLVPEAACPP